jgi:CubicO group peptidase (beta-lactamase class C family)
MRGLQRRAFLTRAGWSAAALGLGAAGPVCLVAGTPATPESCGVSSNAIRDFLEAVAGSPHELHGLVIRRHGQTIAQGWWSPYRESAVHSLYSLSKSLTSTAVGFAVAEDRLSVTDRVIDFFPKQQPREVSDHLAALSVRDLLTMSVGHESDSAPLIMNEDDWISAFLALPLRYESGSVFLYNSGGTYMLSAIVQKVTGRNLLGYLRSRLPAPLGIHDARWAVCPRGINTGGWGLKLTTGSIAKFGQFYLQRGIWEGRQLLPEAWIDDATSRKIQPQPGTSGTSPDANLDELRKTSDWFQGYGYQFWRCRHDAYRGDGGFGQFCVVLPNQNAVIAMTALAPDMQGLLNLVWDHLLAGLHDQPLPEDLSAASRLASELAALSLPIPAGRVDSATAVRIAGRQFVLRPNSLGARSVSLGFARSSCEFALRTGERHAVNCGLGRWLDGVTTMPGTPPEIPLGRTSQPVMPLQVAAAGAWNDDNTLEMQWRYHETPHYDRVICRIEGDRIRITFSNSLTAMNSEAHPELRPVLEGRMDSSSG